MATIASLAILLKGDSTQFEKTLSKAQMSLSKFAGQARAAGRSMMVVGGALTAPLAIGVRQFMVEGDRLAKGAKKIGVTAEAYAGLGHAAQLAGSSQDALDTAIVRLSRNIYDAGRGLSTSVEAFQDLGINFKELEGLSPDEAFLRVAEAIRAETDQAKKLALGQVLLGRSSAELIPMMDEGTDAIRRNIAAGTKLTGISNTQAKAAEELNDRWTDAKTAFAGAAMQAGAALAPAMTRASTAVAGMVMGLGSFIREHPNVVKAAGVVGGAFMGMGGLLYGAAFAARTLRDGLTGIKAVIPIIARVASAIQGLAATAGLAKIALGGVAAAGILVVGYAAVRALNDLRKLNAEIEKTAAMGIDERMGAVAVGRRYAQQQEQLETLKAQLAEAQQAPSIGQRARWIAGGAVGAKKALEFGLGQHATVKALESDIAGTRAGIEITRDRIAALEEAQRMSGQAPGGGGKPQADPESPKQTTLLEVQNKLLEEELAYLREIRDKEGIQ